MDEKGCTNTFDCLHCGGVFVVVILGRGGGLNLILADEGINEWREDVKRRHGQRVQKD